MAADSASVSASAPAPTPAPVLALARASAYLKQNAKELKCEPYNGKQKIILALTSRAALVTTEFLCTQHNTAHTHTIHTHVYLQPAGWLLLLLLKRWSNEKKCQLVQRETATAVAATAGTAAAGSTPAPALEVWVQQKAATTTATTTKHVSNARHSEEY